MSVQQTTPAYRDQTRPPLWRDVRVLRVLLQAGFAVVVVAGLTYLVSNLITNLARAGLPTGFDFLQQPTGFDIRDAEGFSRQAPIRDAVLVGLVNTLRVAIVGIGLATVIGILLGIARLSQNWLVRKSAAAYVEFFRNVPVLVIIIFAYSAVMLELPPISEAAEWLGLVVFSNRGLAIPWGEASVGGQAFLAVMGGALVLAVAVALWRTRRNDETGEPHHRLAWAGGVLLLIAVVGYLALGNPVTLTLPGRDGRVVAGGIALGTEFSALLLGLVIYTASHIAEIVRGSIQAVPKGQSEAANAIALSGFQRMRYVVLPQAFRIMVPPLANQYLNLTKNSSLAIAIGFAEVTRVAFNVIANNAPAPQTIVVLMAVYLSVSLTISAIANLVNRRLSLENR